ncbi:unnamed protein product [Timema podura]|uniref:Uncharacterized protein n=1 Tax=Timema podura TaxID=61482 RepID=A0ABN7NJY4_TIMPD|nr:unnamed protein product [Timema podura]
MMMEENAHTQSTEQKQTNLGEATDDEVTLFIQQPLSEHVNQQQLEEEFIQELQRERNGYVVEPGWRCWLECCCMRGWGREDTHPLLDSSDEEILELDVRYVDKLPTAKSLQKQECCLFGLFTDQISLKDVHQHLFGRRGDKKTQRSKHLEFLFSVMLGEQKKSDAIVAVDSKLNDGTNPQHDDELKTDSIRLNTDKKEINQQEIQHVSSFQLHPVMVT